MDILEIPVIGNRNKDKEKIYTLLSDQPLRNFEGMDFGLLNVENKLSIYFYFLNQENKQYQFLWDIVLPHAIGSILVCDWQDPQTIEENLITIEYIEHRFETPMHICSLPMSADLPDDIIKEELEKGSNRKLHAFDPSSKESAKNILLDVINIR